MNGAILTDTRSLACRQHEQWRRLAAKEKLKYPRLKVEQVVIQLKGEATRQLLEKSLHPFGAIRVPNGRHPKCFARGQWAPFLDDPDGIRRAIVYVEDNPIKEGKKRQKWTFVTPYRPS